MPVLGLAVINYFQYCSFIFILKSFLILQDSFFFFFLLILPKRSGITEARETLVQSAGRDRQDTLTSRQCDWGEARRPTAAWG